MLKISLNNVGKRFNRGWVFRGLNSEISNGGALAILGSNGSGKSTLLRILSGSLTPSQGKVSFHLDSQELAEDQVYKEVAIAAPYLELIQEYTLEEHIAFHFQFKKPLDSWDTSQIAGLLDLQADLAKPIKQYSSGMTQRVKLGLAILSDTPILLLDEPATNLDSNGIGWYNELLIQYAKGRTVVICSNRREEEYHFCDRELIMGNYK